MTPVRRLLLVVSWLVSAAFSGEARGGEALAVAEALPTVAPTIVAQASRGCASSDTCGLTHGFTLAPYDVVLFFCHYRDDGTMTLTADGGVSVTEVFDVSASNGASLSAGWIAYVSGPQTSVTCDLSQNAEAFVAAVQVRGVDWLDPIDSFGTALENSGDIDCPNHPTTADHALAFCAGVGSRAFVSGPSGYDASASWSPHAFPGGGWAGQVHISDHTPPGDLPGGQEWVHSEQGRIISGTVAVKAGEQGVEPYSVAMHVHGSLSEGPGSMASATAGAALAGVDVIWWSDHDHRISVYHAVSNFGFEDWTEPLAHNEAWAPAFGFEVAAPIGWELDSDGGFDTYSAEISSDQAFDDSKSMKLSGARASPAFGFLSYGWAHSAPNPRRSLAADVSIDISIFAEDVSVDARPAVELLLSQQPANAQVAYFTRYRIHYYLDSSTSTPYRIGEIWYVPLAYTTGQWNSYTLEATQDAIAGFPFIDAEDNSLETLLLGVESRNGATVTAYFDALEIDQQVTHTALFAKQRIMLDALEVQTPEVVQLQGTELSWDGLHLNEFSIGTELSDYDEIADLSGLRDQNGLIQSDDTDEFEIEFKVPYLVDKAHMKDGLVSYNHPFGTGGPAKPTTPTQEELADFLTDWKVFDADMLEVGYHYREGTLDEHLWLWDELARRGMHLVGTGVSDTHGGYPSDWLNRINYMVTWVFADAPTKPALLQGMKEGRAFFGDISLFDGSFDLASDGGFRMGQIVVTDRVEHTVTTQIDGLLAGDEVHMIDNQVPNTQIATGSSFSFPRGVNVDLVNGTHFRSEVRRPNSSRNVVVFSNPIHFLPTVPAGGIRPERAAIDLGGVLSRSFVDFHVEAATAQPQGEQMLLTIDGSGSSGTIELDYSGLHPPTSVTLTGITGTWSFANGTLLLENLDGQGSIQVLARRVSVVPALGSWGTGSMLALLLVAGARGASTVNQRVRLGGSA